MCGTLVRMPGDTTRVFVSLVGASVRLHELAVAPSNDSTCVRAVLGAGELPTGMFDVHVLSNVTGWHAAGAALRVYAAGVIAEVVPAAVAFRTGGTTLVTIVGSGLSGGTSTADVAAVTFGDAGLLAALAVVRVSGVRCACAASRVLRALTAACAARADGGRCASAGLCRERRRAFGRCHEPHARRHPLVGRRAADLAQRGCVATRALERSAARLALSGSARTRARAEVPCADYIVCVACALQGTCGPCGVDLPVRCASGHCALSSRSCPRLVPCRAGLVRCPDLSCMPSLRYAARRRLRPLACVCRRVSTVTAEAVGRAAMAAAAAAVEVAAMRCARVASRAARTARAARRAQRSTRVRPA